MTQQIDKASIDNLKALITQHKGSVDATAQTSFCSIWPSAKQGLQLLQTVLQSIPGVSMFAGWAIALVIAAGDAASGALCGK